MDVENIIVDYIANKSTFKTFEKGKSLLSGPVLDNINLDDECVFVLETTSFAPENNFKRVKQLRKTNVQIIVRGNMKQRQNTKLLAKNLINLFASTYNIDIEPSIVGIYLSQSEPIFIEYDANNRPHYSFNISVLYEHNI